MKRLLKTIYVIIILSILPLSAKSQIGCKVTLTDPPQVSAPSIGTSATTQPTCATQTGSVALDGLPGGNWTIICSNGESKTGSGSSYNFSGLKSGKSYTFTVLNSNGCASPVSAQAIINATACLSVLKVVDNPLPIAGSNVVFTISVTNGGPDNATGVYVLESIPDGYEYVSNTADSGTYDQTSGIWTIGDLAVNAKATLKITVKVNTKGEYTNTATVKNNNESDPDSSNDTSTALTEPEILIIPDGFSPNEDGHNDTFTIVHSSYMTIELYVYNRWGNIVFESKNYQNDWKSDDLPDGTYYRIAVVRNTKANTTQKLSGYITLKR